MRKTRSIERPRAWQPRGRRLPAAAKYATKVVDPGSFETAAAAIHVVSPEGLIVDANRAFEVMFGASRRLFLGKHHAILAAEPVAAGLRSLADIRRAVVQAGVWRGTLRNERFNGSTFDCRAHAYPMRVGALSYLVFFQQEVRAAFEAEMPVQHPAREQSPSLTS